MELIRFSQVCDCAHIHKDTWLNEKMLNCVSPWLQSLPTCKLQVHLLQARLIIIRGAQLFSAEKVCVCVGSVWGGVVGGGGGCCVGGCSVYDCPRPCPNPLSCHPDTNLSPLLETGDVSLTLMGQKAKRNLNESLSCVRVSLPLYSLHPCKVEFTYSSPVC